MYSISLNCDFLHAGTYPIPDNSNLVRVGPEFLDNALQNDVVRRDLVLEARDWAINIVRHIVFPALVGSRRMAEAGGANNPASGGASA